MILSCLQGVMGAVYATDTDAPGSALAYLGCFAFFGGKPDEALLGCLPEGFSILTTQNGEWEKCIEACLPSARKRMRYATKKDTVFDTAYLRGLVSALPEGYTLKPIDGALYGKCLQSPLTRDFVGNFESKEQFLALGRGTAVLKGDAIVAGASSYSRYRGGIEIEVDTDPRERRKGLAAAACAELILRCLSEGLYPSWDAQNKASLALAEKLGYTFAREYPVYEAELPAGGQSR